MGIQYNTMEVQIFQFLHFRFWNLGIYRNLSKSMILFQKIPWNPLKSLEASPTSWASSAGLPCARWAHPVESTDFDDSKCWRMLSQPKVDYSQLFNTFFLVILMNSFGLFLMWTNFLTNMLLCPTKSISSKTSKTIVDQNSSDQIYTPIDHHRTIQTAALFASNVAFPPVLGLLTQLEPALILLLLVEVLEPLRWLSGESSTSNMAGTLGAYESCDNGKPWKTIYKIVYICISMRLSSGFSNHVWLQESSIMFNHHPQPPLPPQTQCLVLQGVLFQKVNSSEIWSHPQLTHIPPAIFIDRNIHPHPTFTCLPRRRLSSAGSPVLTHSHVWLMLGKSWGAYHYTYHCDLALFFCSVHSEQNIVITIQIQLEVF